MIKMKWSAVVVASLMWMSLGMLVLGGCQNAADDGQGAEDVDKTAGQVHVLAHQRFQEQRPRRRQIHDHGDNGRTREQGRKRKSWKMARNSGSSQVSLG